MSSFQAKTFPRSDEMLKIRARLAARDNRLSDRIPGQYRSKCVFFPTSFEGICERSNVGISLARGRRQFAHAAFVPHENNRRKSQTGRAHESTMLVWQRRRSG